MRLIGIIWGIVSLLCTTSFAQQAVPNLPENTQFDQAVAKGTRTMTGVPGEKYFVNKASYKIKANFEPRDRMLKVKCHISYKNNSPDPLDEIVIRSLQNYYRPKTPRDERLREAEMTNGMEFSSIIIDGKELTTDLPYDETTTNLIFPLSAPLASGDSIEMDFSYECQITSSGVQRMGKYEDDAFFIAYWYPQVAVYDDLFGWDKIPYKGMVEFYQSQGEFDVEISLPKGFMCWGTGMLQNPDEVLNEKILNRYKEAMNSEEVVRIIGADDYGIGNLVTKDHDSLVWKYSVRGVPDFAFAVSDYYYWDGSSLTIDQPGREVFVDACYNPKARDFVSVALFAREAIEDLSTEIPGIPYPYEAMTVFNGDLGSGGGMEFPMIVNDGSSYSLGSAFRLTYHEIAHTYFPFLMGINERRFAWMDEGWASFLPADLVKEKGFENYPMSSNVSYYERFSGTRGMVPLMQESYTVGGFPYYIQAYFHSSTAYHMLRNLMGDEKFVEALQTYIRRWRGKHPHPYDFFHTFEDVYGEELGWFWRPWFFDTKAADLKLLNPKIKKKKVSLTVKNIGQVPVPIHLVYVFKDGTEEVERISPAVWKEGNETYSLNRKFSKILKTVKLGARDIPDKKNN
ncbi:MAG: M1 family metallopeptidase [Bacteroidota bacterium]